MKKMLLSKLYKTPLSDLQQDCQLRKKRDFYITGPKFSPSRKKYYTISLRNISLYHLLFQLVRKQSFENFDKFKNLLYHLHQPPNLQHFYFYYFNYPGSKVRDFQQVLRPTLPFMPASRPHSTSTLLFQLPGKQGLKMK